MACLCEVLGIDISWCHRKRTDIETAAPETSTPLISDEDVQEIL